MLRRSLSEILRVRLKFEVEPNAGEHRIYRVVGDECLNFVSDNTRVLCFKADRRLKRFTPIPNAELRSINEIPPPEITRQRQTDEVLLVSCIAHGHAVTSS